MWDQTRVYRSFRLYGSLLCIMLAASTRRVHIRHLCVQEVLETSRIPYETIKITNRSTQQAIPVGSTLLAQDEASVVRGSQPDLAQLSHISVLPLIHFVTSSLLIHLFLCTRFTPISQTDIKGASAWKMNNLQNTTWLEVLEKRSMCTIPDKIPRCFPEPS